MISAASASLSAAVGCASQIRTSTVPKLKCGRIDHQTCVYSTIEPVRMQQVDVLAVRLPAAEVVGDAAAREPLGEHLRARRVQAGVDRRRPRASEALTASSIGSTGAQAVAHPHGAVDVAHADVDVQRERVVALGDPLQAVGDAAVVLGVDELLLAVVGARVRAGRAERDAVRRRRGRTAAGAASRWRASASARSSPRPERISISAADQLAGDRLRQQRRPAPRRAAPRSAGPGRASADRRPRTPPRAPRCRPGGREDLGGGVEVDGQVR